MSFWSLDTLSEGILVNLLLLRMRHHRERSNPVKAREGMEWRWLSLISRLHAPVCTILSGLGDPSLPHLIISPISRNFPTGNFLNPFPLRVRAKTLVSSS